MIVIAPDKFKGTLTAAQAAAEIGRAFRQMLPDEEYRVIPVADGGEGTAVTIARYLDMKPVEATSRNAMGSPVMATYFINNRGEVAVDSSTALGLTLIPPGQRDVMHATSAPLGRLLVHIIERHNPSRIYLGVGGTGTSDGGAGMIQALGATLRGIDRDATPAILNQVTAVDFSTMIPLPEIIPLCDVDVPLVALDGEPSAMTFAGQKGLSPGDKRQLEAALRHWDSLIHPPLKFSGAGGGLVSALLSRYPGRYGADEILALSPISRLSPDIIITGEGCVDEQSAMGKITGKIAALGHRLGARVIAIGGMVKPCPALSETFYAIYSTVKVAPGCDDPSRRLYLTALLAAEKLLDK